MKTKQRCTAQIKESCLEQLADLHDHICPRQILGVRMGQYAAQLLNLDLPQSDKRLFTFVETDGCFADGVAVATGCWLGHRTLRLMDYGKVAATFVDTVTSHAVRIWPNSTARTAAAAYAPPCSDRWHAQLDAYQTMPTSELLCSASVALTLSLEVLISKPGHRVTCECCGEEILNEREVIMSGRTFCKHCADGGYYQR